MTGERCCTTRMYMITIPMAEARRRLPELIPLRGLIEVVGSWEKVERGEEETRGRLRASLARTARLIAGPARRPKR